MSELKPPLTVCITTYNRWSLCLKALESVFGQTGVEMEVILVDDCSTHPMPTDVRTFIEKNQVFYIRHETNKGLAAARNTAIFKARGKYFSFCDDDDQWPQGHAAGLINAMQHGKPSVGMALGLARFQKKACQKIFKNNQKLSQLFFAGFTPPVGSQIYKTEIIKKAGGYNPKILSGVDHDLWINLLEINPKVAVNWGTPVIVGNELNRVRMTTFESRRRKGIQDSLEIWKPKIINSLGNDFYRHFYSSYQKYLDYGFFIKACRNKNYPKAFIKLFNINVMEALIIKTYNKMKRHSNCNLFPTFKSR